MTLGSGDTVMGIRRPAAPKRALPDSLRHCSSGDGSSDHFYKPGAGTLAPTGLVDGKYRAGSQRNFLKRNTGKPMSQRSSAQSIVVKGAFSSASSRPRFSQNSGTFGKSGGATRTTRAPVDKRGGAARFDASQKGSSRSISSKKQGGSTWWDRY